MKIVKRRGPKKRYRKFENQLSKTAVEEIDRIVKDAITTQDIWDSKHFCNAYWTITVHLQPYED